ncbi:phospholipid/cholesterol/gamma-HCH transport system permease protein [Algoriella xinjiangensis]|uniref:Phospholipid/cholesterol/gamma-HCH transport system permease protein n=1 Tax=Algoriella xinjiangensis TaxID=684065 RepID=A0A1I5AP42_9FLAO|nr:MULTISPECIES: ABC transporter permease [Algoriella]MBO6213179.1 ABC transporter permease [Algoriella sp.]SFN64244.1 phospholipid/cholesterol/gamma-HCH transport system permease protein [Algoriella xinjiangensis]VDH17034.1 Probable phospholipid ABC transporter permease protein mlaE [Algoriella xinjiangensis]
MKLIENIGSYFMLMGKVFSKPQKWSVFWKLTVREIYDLGVNSLGIVTFISTFMGAVVAIQMAQNFQGSAIPVPDAYIGYATKVVLVLEFAPTIMSLILVGKVGSYIASSIGTMRVTEQIDALDVMGINSANFLILPKIIACVFFNPLLVMVSIGFGLLGGYYIGVFTQLWSAADFITGLQMNMATKLFVYTFVKTMVFAFVIATIPAYYGYNVKGGSLEVGRSSTTAVVWTSVTIIVINLILTQTILS